MVSSSGGVKDSWASARPRMRRSKSPADASKIYVCDPEGTELEVSGVEDEALPNLVGKFDAVEEYPAGAGNAARSTSRPRKGSA